jgi:hypothetical protein
MVVVPPPLVVPPPPPDLAAAKKLPKTTAELVEELVLILEETKSEETFTLTVGVLTELGEEAKGAIPSILRNAERLQLLNGKDSDRSLRLSSDLRKAIQAILGKSTNPSWNAPRSLCPACADPSLPTLPSKAPMYGSDFRSVTAQEPEVRSGPSQDARFYVTNRLQRGTKVEVIGELPDGWLKIRPPEGSFSYINLRVLNHPSPNQPNYFVSMPHEDVPVFIGSELHTQRPSIIGAKLKAGTLVVSVGPPITEGGETLLPIEPPFGEARYIRAEAVNQRQLNRQGTK